MSDASNGSSDSTTKTGAKRAAARRALGTLGPLLALFVVTLLIGLGDFAVSGTSGRFLSIDNLRTVAAQTSVTAIAALGMTLIIIAGGIDLASGTALALCATVLAWSVREDVGFRILHGDSYRASSHRLNEAIAELDRLASDQADRRDALIEARDQARDSLRQILQIKLDNALALADEELSDAEQSKNQQEIDKLRERLELLRSEAFAPGSVGDWEYTYSNATSTVFWALLFALLTGAACGLLNGVLISALRLAPFIVTLGTMTIFVGLGNYICDSVPIRPDARYQIPAGLRQINSLSTTDFYAGLPLVVWLAVALAVVLAVALRYTVFGRYVFALGSNESTARLCGVNVNRTKIAVYTLAGLFFAVAGICSFSKTSTGTPEAGLGMELDIIAAVVIGGGSLSGGRGSVLGTLAGAAIMAVIANGCTHLELAAPVKRIIVGVVIIGAVVVDQLRQRRSEHA